MVASSRTVFPDRNVASPNLKQPVRFLTKANSTLHVLTPKGAAGHDDDDVDAGGDLTAEETALLDDDAAAMDDENEDADGPDGDGADESDDTKAYHVKLKAWTDKLHDLKAALEAVDVDPSMFDEEKIAEVVESLEAAEVELGDMPEHPHLGSG